MPPTTRLRYQLPLGLFMAILQFSHAAQKVSAEVSVQPIADRIEQVTFDRKALGSRKHFCVVLPQMYDADKQD